MITACRTSCGESPVGRWLSRELRARYEFVDSDAGGLAAELDRFLGAGRK